jgi:hypothetical protein
MAAISTSQSSAHKLPGLSYLIVFAPCCLQDKKPAGPIMILNPFIARELHRKALSYKTLVSVRNATSRKLTHGATLVVPIRSFKMSRNPSFC